MVADKLLPSTRDDIALVDALNTRWQELCNDWLRLMGEPIHAPHELKLEHRRALRMYRRHRSGDYRHTVSELKSVQTCCQWTVDMKNIMRNQPDEVIEWKDG